MSHGKNNRLGGAELRTALENACRGLLYISETDAPIVPVLIERPGSPLEETVRDLEPEGSMATRTLDEFFDGLTKYQIWHGDEERKRVRQFRRVERMLLDNLEEPKVFKIGRIRFRIFVLGYDAAGNIAGIRTGSVET